MPIAGHAYGLPGFSIGTRYLTTPTPDGGFVVAVSAWNSNANVTLALVFDDHGTLVTARALPEPTSDQDVFASRVRYDASSHSMVVNESDDRTFRLRWYSLR